jgi:predicted dehydrogenase
MQTNKIKWGIIGLGNIAQQFARDLKLVQEAELYAVGSRNIQNAKKFASKNEVEKAYGSYEEVMKDPEVSIIYIATPHDSHAELSIQCLEHGKHVLVEKPIALNVAQATKMIAASKKANRFLMEAFWTRFNPTFQEVLQKVQNEVLGEITYINADFAFIVDIPKNRLTDIKNGGGTLLDIGVYPLFLSYMVLGMPSKILATASFMETGADKQTSMILQYEKAHAVLHSSFVASSNMVATISGAKGKINIHPVWHETQGYSMIKNNHKVDYSFPTKGKGFTYEIEECHTCIRQGKIESSQWSHQNSLDLISLVDAVKKQIGLEFPSETEIN